MRKGYVFISVYWKIAGLQPAIFSGTPKLKTTVVEKTNGTGRDLCSKWPI